MGLEDPVDAALALCGVDALCYDVNETLSGWVLYGSARRDLVTLLGTLFVFWVAPLYSDGSTCYYLFAVPSGLHLVARSGGYACPGTFFVLGKCGSLKDKLNACAHRCVRLLMRGRIQAAGQQKR